MKDELIKAATGFLVLFVAFGLIELTRRRARRQPIFRRGYFTDLGYIFLNPIMNKTVVGFAFALAVVPVGILIYGHFDEKLIHQGFGPLSRLPFAVQAILGLLITDFMGYWMHRLFHGRRLWSFHAVHHSSRTVDWLAGARNHPVNEILNRIATVIPLLLIGLNPMAVAAIVPALMLFAVTLHANVDWDFGPLRYVIASPLFHRWHHTDETEARDKNFAAFFPVWDLMFGTFYMPRDRLPASFGTSTPVPEGVIRQLVWPFRRRRINT